jgi:hypothetical protein
VIIATAGTTSPPAVDSAEGQMIRVLDDYGPVMDGETFAEKCIAAGMNATTHCIYRLISPVICSVKRGFFCKVGIEVPPGTLEEVIARRPFISLPADYGWTPDGKLWFGRQLTRQMIVAGGIRLASFVADFVQGDWRVRLPDGTEHGTVSSRGVFIWSFRKAFALLGAEPADLVAFQFDLKARYVLVKVGGPDLYELIQEGDSAADGVDLEEACA